MKIERIIMPSVTRAESIRISKNYIVACTGQAAYLYDKDMHPIKQFKGLKYAYISCISPDETKIALISNGNYFYIIDVATLSIDKVRVTGICGGDLEGRGCWSFDSRYLYLLPLDANTCNNTLRIYDTNDWSYRDKLRDMYFISIIKRADGLKKYFAFGFDREDGICGTHKLILFDDSDFCIYNLQTKQGSFSYVENAFYEDNERRILVNTDIDSFYVDLQGAVISQYCKQSEEATKSIQSRSGKYFVLYDNNGVEAVSTSIPSEKARMRIQYGVMDIEEIGNDIFLLSTRLGLKLIQISTT